MKKVIITGGTGAIGAALIKEFARDYEVIFTYFENKTKAEAISSELCVKGYQCDIRDRTAVDMLFETEKTCDVLINNAGISEIKMFTDITNCDWENMLAVNLTGAFNMTACALGGMLDKKNGAVINISSIWGVIGASCEVHYSAAKAGLIGFTKSLAKEMGPSGIRVNCIAPGVIESPMNAALGEEILEELRLSSALMKLGTPADVAGAARYLAEAEFVTGQVLHVDGGFNAT